MKCQHLEDLHNSVNQHAPHVKHHAWVKDPFKEQARQVDFNVTQNKTLLIWILIRDCC